MKKLFVAALLAVSAVAHAHGSSHPSPTQSTSESSVVPYPAYSRVLRYTDERNSLTADGVIVVCELAFEPSRPSQCLDTKGSNAWIPIDRIKIPGYILSGFEYRLLGSNGGRNLFLYFSPAK